MVPYIYIYIYIYIFLSNIIIKKYKEKTSNSFDLIHLFVLLLCTVNPVRAIFPIDIFNELLHLCDLSFETFLILQSWIEQFVLWPTVRSADSVPKGCKLSIVVVEVQVMHSVACSTIDDWVVRHVVSVMDHHSPAVNKGKQAQIRNLVQWHQQWVNVVGQGLNIAVHGVECVRSKWCAHKPLVVGLMKSLVDGWVV